MSGRPHAVGGVIQHRVEADRGPALGSQQGDPLLAAGPVAALAPLASRSPAVAPGGRRGGPGAGGLRPALCAHPGGAWQPGAGGPGNSGTRSSGRLL